MRGMVVGPDEHRDMLALRASQQRVAHARPRFAQTLARGWERRADLVPLRRQVPDEHLPAGRAGPAEQIALLAGLTTPAPPQHPIPDSELTREFRPGRRVAERVGRVQHVQPPAQPLGVGGTEEEVADQRLPRGDELVREHVPRPDLESPRLDESLDLRVAVGARLQVVLEEDGLAVEQEAAVPGIGVESRDQIVEHRHEPRVE